jgi:hypothetical protein
MKERIEKVLIALKYELEKAIPFTKSEITTLEKPSMMGRDGLYFNFETINSGIAVFYWNTGVFEIRTDMLTDKDGNFFLRSFVPLDYEHKHYPIESFYFFNEKINELILLLNNKYNY